MVLVTYLEAVCVAIQCQPLEVLPIDGNKKQQLRQILIVRSNPKATSLCQHNPSLKTASSNKGEIEYPCCQPKEAERSTTHRYTTEAVGTVCTWKRISETGSYYNPPCSSWNVHLPQAVLCHKAFSSIASALLKYTLTLSHPLPRDCGGSVLMLSTLLKWNSSSVARADIPRSRPKSAVSSKGVSGIIAYKHWSGCSHQHMPSHAQFR